MNEVKPRAVPQIQGFRVQDFVSLIENEAQDGVDYVSENYWKITLNRQSIDNICKF